ncbi:MAG: OmpA family protein [Sulfurimonas sp.]
MKSLVLSGVVASLLLFSGCSDKAPVVDQKPQVAQKAQEVTPVASETVSTEDSSVNSISHEMTIKELETQLTSVYFDFDKFNIDASMQDKVSADAGIVKGKAVAYSVKLEGNCDEWGSDEYNFALGLKRANAVKKSLIAEGVAESRISMVSYGESNPVCSDKTQDCWSKNRRVDFSLLP